MKGGHNSKPVEQRIEEGNPGKRPIPKVPSIGGAIEHGAEPDPPEYLDEVAADAWRRIMPLLTRVGVVRTGDLDAFEVLCEAVSLHRGMSEELRSYRRAHATLLIQGARGEQAHPLLAASRSERQTILRYLERFGLDPQSRTRLGAQGESGEGAEPEDDMDELNNLFVIPGGGDA